MLLPIIPFFLPFSHYSLIQEWPGFSSRLCLYPPFSPTFYLAREFLLCSFKLPTYHPILHDISARARLTYDNTPFHICCVCRELVETVIPALKLYQLSSSSSDSTMEGNVLEQWVRSNMSLMLPFLFLLEYSEVLPFLALRGTRTR